MKTLNKLCALLVLGAAALPSFGVQVDSFKIEPTFVPRLSPAMLADGITEGRLVLAINVSEEGELTDTLVLGYSHRGLVAPMLDAIKTWKFTPARVDGQPVPVHTKLTIAYNAEGVVISRTAMENLDARIQQLFGYRLKEHPATAAELDAPPTRVTTVNPAYPKDAVAQGVTGTVRVHFYIDKDGVVRMPSVDATAHPYLADLAVSALREWRFAPPMSHGKPVLIAARQDFAFGR